MHHAPVTAARKPAGLTRWIVAAAILSALVLLAWDAQAFLTAALKAIRYPFELDYGEGIVWQQAEQMRTGDAYGSIIGFPAIVFHYPPLYHALTLAVSSVAGIDMLKAGRIVSVAATLLTGLLAGLIAARTVQGEIKRSAALLCAAIASLAVLSLSPVSAWGPLMRVDMVAVAFSLAGIWCTMQAFARPRFIHLAGVCFVAAVFTKQTAIAAPAAAFLTLLLLKPRTAFAGIATCLGLGLAVLAPLAWVTHGGFLRHIFLYNINRFDPTRLGAMVGVLAQHGAYIAVVAIALAKRRRIKPFSIRELRENQEQRHGDASLLLLLVYLAFAAVMMLTIAKVGSNINYMVEALCVVAILVGVACKEAAEALVTGSGVGGPSGFLLRVALPVAVAVQAMSVPRPAEDELREPKLTQARQLVQMIHEAKRPVISDDMVLVKRAGRQVVWEPAIFAELASKHMWDERPFVARVRSGRFAFFITRSHRGRPLFDSRYTPAVADAMDAAYPVQRRMGDYVLHLPSDGAAAR